LSNYIHAGQHKWHSISAIVKSHLWFKILGYIAFTSLFFWGYIYLLKHPAYPVTTIPLTIVDQFVAFEPWALPIYLSLWVYLSFPPLLMLTKRELIEYGVWIGGLCFSTLAIFYFWPNAVPPANIDWEAYPGMGFLKGVDAGGNACPSLHVATAVFSAYWLHWRLPSIGLGTMSRLVNIGWCVAVAYSTMATKQHVAIDVIAGGMYGLAVAWCYQKVKEQPIVINR
jgi:membrane-associated phospholipid phosphatase